MFLVYIKKCLKYFKQAGIKYLTNPFWNCFLANVAQPSHTPSSIFHIPLAYGLLTLLFYPYLLIFANQFPIFSRKAGIDDSFFNWDSLHTRLNKVWGYEKKKEGKGEKHIGKLSVKAELKLCKS